MSIRATVEALGVELGVPVQDLDDDQLDAIAIRLVVECGDDPTPLCMGRIVDSVRWSRLRVVSDA